MDTGEGGGSKTGKILRTSFMNGPNMCKVCKAYTKYQPHYRISSGPLEWYLSGVFPRLPMQPQPVGRMSVESGTLTPTTDLQPQVSFRGVIF